jgi:hypothetical protein
MEKVLAIKHDGKTEVTRVNFNVPEVKATDKAKWVASHANDYFVDLDEKSRKVEVAKLYDELTGTTSAEPVKAAETKQ